MGDRVAVMSKGVLQQVDAPQRLYDRPENLFVAGFIGTPPMNLLEATVVGRTAASRVDLGGNPLPIADEALAQYPRLREYDGRNVIVGLRAGDLHPGAGPRPTCRRSTARVELVESLGGESMAYFKVDARQIKSRGDRRRRGARRSAEDEESVVGSRPNLVASFPPHVQLRLGDDVADRRRHARTCTSSTKRRVRRFASARSRRSRGDCASRQCAAGSRDARPADRRAARARSRSRRRRARWRRSGSTS